MKTIIPRTDIVIYYRAYSAALVKEIINEEILYYPNELQMVSSRGILIRERHRSQAHQVRQLA